MPTYSYSCTACDNKFDVTQSFSDDALNQCPACGGRLRKLFGKVGVVFKGSGFYRTDSRAAAKNSSDGSNGSDSSSSGSEQKSDSGKDGSSASSSSSSSGSTNSATPATAASS